LLLVLYFFQNQKRLKEVCLLRNFHFGFEFLSLLTYFFLYVFFLSWCFVNHISVVFN
jgi:hypothetical protein